jgi:hypothetical protein
MQEIYELDIYKLAEELSDLIWYAFDKWSVKAQNTIGYQIIRSSDALPRIFLAPPRRSL